MNSLLIKHIVIQLGLLLFYLANEATVNIINSLMRISGINPSDTHLSLGVFVFAGLSIVLPSCYLVFTERKDKERISRYFNFWFFRLEVIFLTIIGINIFIS